jgi:hypothetical protein
LTSAVDLANPAAGGPDAPVEVHVAFDGDDPRLAAEAIDPIRRLGTIVDDDVALVPYGDTLADGATPPPGLRFVARSGFVAERSVPDALAVVAATVASKATPVIGVRSVSGAASRVPADATAYAHRDADLLIVTLTAGPPAVVDAAMPSLDALWERLAPHVQGAYANFLSAATEADVAAAYPRATYRRLAEVKRRYDPGNLFAANHNVRPAAPLRHAARRPARRPALTMLTGGSVR